MKTGSIRHRLFALPIAGVIGLPAAPCHAQGNVVCWGHNQAGQTSVPSGLTGVRSIAAGGESWDEGYTLAVKANGQLVGWGDNYFGQAVPPAGLPAVLQVAASGYYGRTVAVCTNGRVVSWGGYVFSSSILYGTDVDGEAADGQPGDPVMFGGEVFTQAIQVAAGYEHSVALSASGQVISWGTHSGSSTLLFGTDVGGSPAEGVLGQPMRRLGQTISGATRVVAGDGFTVVLLAGGSIASFQDFAVPPYTFDMTVPASLAQNFGITDLAGNYDHAAARLSNGTVVCWGSNRYGESLGTTTGGAPITSTPTGTPVRRNGVTLTGVSKVAVGQDHTLALLTTGKVVAWGRNNGGQCLGTSSAGSAILGEVTTQVVKVNGTDIASITAISAGDGHSVALIGTGVTAECPSDFDTSGAVDFGDIALIMLDFGPCNDCPIDLDGSGMVDMGDVAFALLDFGSCPG